MVRILALACEKILAEDGPDGLNTNRIAEVAGVPIGSLYRYFPNKEALIAEVYERQLEALALTYETGWAEDEAHAPRSLDDALRLHVEGNASMHRKLLRLHQAFYRQHQASLDLGDRMSERYDRSFLAQAEAWLGIQLRRFEGELGASDVELATFIVTRSIAGALRSAARDAPDRLSDPAFCAALVRMALAFLRTKT
jgi:AcrR family transcriptional regulator